MKKPTFTTHNTKQGAKAASTTRCGFFVAFYRQVYNTDSGVIAFSVNRKVGLPLFGIVRGRMSMAPLFLCLTYQRGKDYISVHRIKSTNKMRPTNNALNFLRETVSTTPEYIAAKKLLHEVYTTYYLSEHFTQTTEELKQAVAFQAVLFSDLLDDLFLSSLQKSSQSCNS